MAQWEEPRALKKPPGETSGVAGKDTLVNTGKQHGAEYTGAETQHIAPPAAARHTHRHPTPDRGSPPSSPTAPPRRHTPLSDKLFPSIEID